MKLSLGRMLEKVERIGQPFLWAVQGIIFVISGVTAFFLRFDLAVPARQVQHLAYALMIWIVVKSLVFWMARLDRGWWRFVSLYDVPRLALANLLGSLISAVAIVLFAPSAFPRSLYLLDFLICMLLTAGARLSARIIIEVSRFQRTTGKKRTLIYGAGEAGLALLREVQKNPTLPYEIIGFIDDNPNKVRLLICGAKVLAAGIKLKWVVAKYRIDTVLIAIPSASGMQMTQILRRCQDAGVSSKTVPGLAEVFKGNGLVKTIRDIAAEDLLGRNPACLDENAIATKLQGKVVFVSGAGGSIGSELCRQIARFHPQAIVGYEISENALFHLDLEMKSHFARIPFHPEVGNIQNSQRVSEVLERYRPSILYHAAAYKHLPMMERNIFEALENNVFGTYTMALAAAEHGLDDFVMISTDKAVRPTSIMGVTKRLAELAVNSLQNGQTRFVSVRFGNVLGSNGSVVPLFKKQIEAGGPVTVTHPDMQRYFMTIPEASQLVVQASTMGTGGEVFVLDMGDPVKIVDLARNLILLSGLRPDEDIRIEFSGIRPGEKLHEELSTFEESTVPTKHDKVKIFIGPSVADKQMKTYIASLQQMCAARAAAQLILHCKEIVPEYNPSSHVLRGILAAKRPHDDRAANVLLATA